MGTQAVLNDITECKRCENRESNRESRRQCDQADLDQLLESVQRLKLIGRTLWEFDSFDKEERGTVAIMLNREADQIFEIMGGLETRLGE